MRFRRRPRVAGLAAILAVSLLGFRDARAGDAAGPAVAVPSPVGAPEHLESVARRVEMALDGRDAAAFDALIDADRLLAAASAGLAAPPSVRADFERSVRETSFGAAIVQGLGENGSYRFLRVVDRAGSRRALFRLSGPAGVNYHEIFVDGHEGAAKVVDLLDHATGERLSETLRDALLAHLARLPDAEEHAPAGPERDLLASRDRVSRMEELIAAEKWDDALLAWGALPESVRWQRRVARKRLEAAWRLGAERFAPVLSQYRERFPDDASVDIRLVAASGQEPAETTAAIERLERRLGPDAGLHLLRSYVATRDGDLPGALAAAKRAVEAEPDFRDAWWALLWTSLAAHDFAETTRTLLLIEQGTKTVFGDLRTMPRFAHYVESPEHERYLAAHRGKGR